MTKGAPNRSARARKVVGDEELAKRIEQIKEHLGGDLFSLGRHQVCLKLFEICTSPLHYLSDCSYKRKKLSLR